MNKAKPCPCCSSENLKWKMNSHTCEIWIHCDTCGCTGPAGASKTEAGEAWNKMERMNTEAVPTAV